MQGSSKRPNQRSICVRNTHHLVHVQLKSVDGDKSEESQDQADGTEQETDLWELRLMEPHSVLLSGQ